MAGLGVLVALVLLTVVPLGSRLLRGAPALPLWYLAAAPAVTALLVPTGPVAVALALPWAVLTGRAALGSLVRDGAVRRVAAASAGACLAIAGGALLVDRSGVELFGFDHERWRLTVLHFCVAGFACSLLAGLTHLATGRARWVVAALPVGTSLVALGHFVGEEVELAGAVVLTGALLGLAVAVVRGLGTASQLVLVSALTPVATMALAVWWAVGELLDSPHLSLGETAATHGVANALGVGLCGVLGWTTLTKEQL